MMCVFARGTFQDTFYWQSGAFSRHSGYEGPHKDAITVRACVTRVPFSNQGRKVSFSLSRLSFPDVDECNLQTHTCWNHSVCVNLPGGYDCVCTSGPGCSGDCQQDKGIRRNGEDWKPSFDRCALCSCKVERVWVQSPLQKNDQESRIQLLSPQWGNCSGPEVA